MNIKRTNKYGASIVRCKEHMEQLTSRHGFTSDLLPDVETDEICRICEEELLEIEAPYRMREALLDPDCTHTRYRRGYVTAYCKDSDSPTGVLSRAGLDAKRFDILYNHLIATRMIKSRLSTLSPTEGLMKGI